MSTAQKIIENSKNKNYQYVINALEIDPNQVKALGDEIHKTL